MSSATPADAARIHLRLSSIHVLALGWTVAASYLAVGSGEALLSMPGPAAFRALNAVALASAALLVIATLRGLAVRPPSAGTRVLATVPLVLLAVLEVIRTDGAKDGAWFMIIWSLVALVGIHFLRPVRRD